MLVLRYQRKSSACSRLASLLASILTGGLDTLDPREGARRGACWVFFRNGRAGGLRPLAWNKQKSYIYLYWLNCQVKKSILQNVLSKE